MRLLAGPERTLNTLLARDPAAPGRLARLAGQRILIRLQQPPLALAVHFHATGLDLLRPDDASAQADNAAKTTHEAPKPSYDAVVELDAETAGALLGGASPERLMFQGKLSVRGRVELLEATRELLVDLDLDWEGELARWLGDIPAHGLAEGLRRMGRWGVRARQELHADISEYVFEEARLLPGRHQLSATRDHLTELEIATDRLEARLAKLRRRLEGIRS
ncbi:SCP2 sterol-binding domain-containing protein [Halomonas sp. TRM85114]|uniref:ubiquinone biosynthesis accessory factor UbiJ n=1 Tax=Halomonas jincaotanensis TaxID=2810616 RepID=UPI001BD2E353|nr:SCP2 sterol-binding domain-containing protein [Halomonas jincaotanensis]MBS9403145.1 SCP2 sterol-binding domain-containing protein [Halomonas jincaotanensis]